MKSTDLCNFDVVIVGGGLLGLATGLGLARLGARTIVFDAGGDAFCASRGNFGLVWAQSKGARTREYATWTRAAIRGWPALQQEILDLTGINTHYRNGRGVHLCLGAVEYKSRGQLIDKVVAHKLPHDDTRMIGRNELLEMVPQVGPEVIGGSVSSLDGDCHSLALYRGLAMAYRAAGGRLEPGAPVHSIVPESGGYRIEAKGFSAHAPKVLIVAGLASNDLAQPFGFPRIVRPQKGQILVTERAAPFLPVVTSGIRQTPEGTVLIGDTKEEAGFDDRSTGAGVSYLARRAVRIFPRLASLRVVRSWAALRVLTPDGDPVYDESPTHKGIFVATTHSGVTLAPAHRGPLADWILNDHKPPEFSAFSAQRFTA